jgi:hypothetical protein
MEYKIPVSKNEYYKAILEILNFNLKLSELELKIVSTMLENEKYVADKDCRELIRINLKLSKFMTANYIKRLRDKGILEGNTIDRVYTLNPVLINLSRDNKVSFELDIV